MRTPAVESKVALQVKWARAESWYASSNSSAHRITSAKMQLLFRVCVRPDTVRRCSRIELHIRKWCLQQGAGVLKHAFCAPVPRAGN